MEVDIKLFKSMDYHVLEVLQLWWGKNWSMKNVHFWWRCSVEGNMVFSDNHPLLGFFYGLLRVSSTLSEFSNLFQVLALC